jgi:hypothetical protein
MQLPYRKGGWLMARFYTFAEVLTKDHPRWQQLHAPLLDRFGPPRGIRLRDFLDRSGGRYEKKLHLADTFRERARILGEATGDEELLEIAAQAEYTVSLEHLRGTDPTHGSRAVTAWRPATRRRHCSPRIPGGSSPRIRSLSGPGQPAESPSARTRPPPAGQESRLSRQAIQARRPERS